VKRRKELCDSVASQNASCLARRHSVVEVGRQLWSLKNSFIEPKPLRLGSVPFFNETAFFRT
jgi:hypothetical protein